MDSSFHAGGAQTAPDDAGASGARTEALRCDICNHRLGGTVSYLEETGDVPDPRQSWVLCTECNGAVHEQMERAPVRSPLRLRVAIGIVSTERTPTARRAHLGQLSDTSWMKLFFWLFLITMLVHLAIIVAIAGIVK
ncbi:MAG: hypothetical protein ACRDHP_02510 [Ktedonobacterales bacterium]